MEFGLRIPPCEDPRQVADLVWQAEQAGFGCAWIPDSQLLWRDLWVTLGVIAARTSRIILGTNVTNPLTRDVTVTASAAAAMDEASDGRFILGYGSGDSSVRVMGWKTSRIEVMRTSIATMRSLWRGETTAPHGQPDRRAGAPGRDIPVYISATGPRMLSFAGEAGDGVIVLAGISEDAIRNATSRVTTAAAAAGRAAPAVATGLFCYVGDDWRDHLIQARPYAALYAIRHRDNLIADGLAVPEPGPITGIYPDLSHAQDWDRAIDATSWVPDDFLAQWCAKYCIIGSARDAAAKIAQLESYGVTSLYIRGFYSYELPAELCHRFSRDVMPLMAAPAVTAPAVTAPAAAAPVTW
jgi:5,10-methylenetetrahydromethanopterin reductase